MDYEGRIAYTDHQDKAWAGQPEQGTNLEGHEPGNFGCRNISVAVRRTRRSRVPLKVFDMPTALDDAYKLNVSPVLV